MDDLTILILGIDKHGAPTTGINPHALGLVLDQSAWPGMVDKWKEQIDRIFIAHCGGSDDGK